VVTLLDNPSRNSPSANFISTGRVLASVSF
jgi:hypothetical protein